MFKEEIEAIEKMWQNNKEQAIKESEFLQKKARKQFLEGKIQKKEWIEVVKAIRALAEKNGVMYI